MSTCVAPWVKYIDLVTLARLCGMARAKYRCATDVVVMCRYVVA